MSSRDGHNEHPSIYYRVDNFCKDKRPGDMCSIPGTTFAGGGEGQCKNYIASDEDIEMSCIRKGEVQINRKLPEWGSASPLVDQFCQEKREGNPCQVELTYLGSKEREDGVCKQIIESRWFYNYGYQTESRQLLRCEPVTEITRTFSAVSWHEKLFP